MNKIRSLLTFLALLIAVQSTATANVACTSELPPVVADPIDSVWPPIWWPGG